MRQNTVVSKGHYGTFYTENTVASTIPLAFVLRPSTETAHQKFNNDREARCRKMQPCRAASDADQQLVHERHCPAARSSAQDQRRVGYQVG